METLWQQPLRVSLMQCETLVWVLLKPLADLKMPLDMLNISNDVRRKGVLQK